ncbi:hypothetical protein EDB83DRAFT_2235051, partial [Lactarius deliciosus]
ENMAAVVWTTLELYGIQNKIIAIMMDNASNNNTMIKEIEHRCHQAGHKFCAKDARMWCMPHTIHLAAIKLLEGIGLISKADSELAASSNFIYQDEINTRLECEYDPEAAPEDDGGDIETVPVDPSENIQTAVQKLRKIIRSVRSSPQRRQIWYQEVEKINAQIDINEQKSSLILILDVKTQWSSTHQMLRMFIFSL